MLFILSRFKPGTTNILNCKLTILCLRLHTYAIIKKKRCIQLGVKAMLQQINRYSEKALPFMTPTSVILGILLSKYLLTILFSFHGFLLSLPLTGA